MVITQKIFSAVIASTFLSLSTLGASLIPVSKVVEQKFYQDFQNSCRQFSNEGDEELAGRLKVMAKVIANIDWSQFSPFIVDAAPDNLKESLLSPMHHLFDNLFRCARWMEHEKLKPAVYGALGYEEGPSKLKAVRKFLAGVIEHYNLHDEEMKIVALCLCAARCLKKWSVFAVASSFNTSEVVVRSSTGLCVDFVTLAQDFLDHFGINNRRGIVTSPSEAMSDIQLLLVAGAATYMSCAFTDVSYKTIGTATIIAAKCAVTLATGKHHFVIFQINGQEYVADVLVPFKNWCPDQGEPSMKIFKK